MKDLIIIALNQANEDLNKIGVPLTKPKTKYVNIDDVKPLDIEEFMRDNNIPDNAEFGGKPNGYDDVCLCYDIDVPTTEKEQLNFKIKRFSTIAFKKVYDLLIINGYKRIGMSSALYKEFNDTTVYDMYVNNEFDRLVKYYSLSFAKS